MGTSVAMQFAVAAWLHFPLLALAAVLRAPALSAALRSWLAPSWRRRRKTRWRTQRRWAWATTWPCALRRAAARLYFYQRLALTAEGEGLSTVHAHHQGVKEAQAFVYGQSHLVGRCSLSEVLGFIGFTQGCYDVRDGGTVMGVTCLVLRPDGLLGLFELTHVPCLTGGLFNVGHDHQGNDIILDDDTVALGLVCLDSQLLD